MGEMTLRPERRCGGEGRSQPDHGRRRRPGSVTTGSDVARLRLLRKGVPPPGQRLIAALALDRHPLQRRRRRTGQRHRPDPSRHRLILDIEGHALLTYEADVPKGQGFSAGLAFNLDPVTERGLPLTWGQDLVRRATQWRQTDSRGELHPRLLPHSSLRFLLSTHESPRKHHCCSRHGSGCWRG